MSTALNASSRLGWFNELTHSEAGYELHRCCGSTRWAERMAVRRPFPSVDVLLRTADDEWWNLNESDWKEAFLHHPKIGDVESAGKNFTITAGWASNEQSGTRHADEQTFKGLAEGNRSYEEQFGYIFIVYATGKSGEEMLRILRNRLANPPETEIRIAAGEQAKITRLRLKKLLSSDSQFPQP